jgi:hypothetical protein
MIYIFKTIQIFLNIFLFSLVIKVFYNVSLLLTIIIVLNKEKELSASFDSFFFVINNKLINKTFKSKKKSKICKKYLIQINQQTFYTLK